jgi:hypothetical protein
MKMIQTFRADRTDAMATRVPINDRRACWLAWRIAVPVLTLLFVVYPAIMSIPDHGPMPGAIAPTAAMPVQAGVHESCPPADLCPAVAIEQALPRLPAPPLLLLATVVLFLAMRWQRHTPTHQRDWWPPGPRRALLQVFLI